MKKPAVLQFPREIKQYFLLFFITFFFISGITAQTRLDEKNALLENARFFENFEIREQLGDVIKAPYYTQQERPRRVYSQLVSPVSVAVEVRKSATSFYLLFINGQNSFFPVWGKGNYILKKNLFTDEYEQLKVFLQNDEGSFIRVYPDGNRCSLEIYLFGHRLYQNIMIPVSFESVILSPFSRILNLTEDIVNWEILFANSELPEYELVSDMVWEIRGNLDRFRESDDGAMNADGEWVRIEDGSLVSEESKGVNCSGFAKWVADGIYAGWQKGPDYKYLSIDELKRERRTNAETGMVSASYPDRDPFFGLDWIRNIAIKLQSAWQENEPDPFSRDVTNVPYNVFYTNTGYKLSNLRSLMYLMAVEYPGDIYFGAVNSEFGSDPAIRQYHHVAVFFPYFTTDGEFQLIVMETGTESSPEILENRYPDSNLYLERVTPGLDFKPPEPPLAEPEEE